MNGIVDLDTARDKLCKAISPALLGKWDKLIENIKSFDSVALAYSGGVDSTFLASASFLALGDRMIAITIQSPLESPGQTTLAAQFAQEIGFAHQILPFDPLEDPLIRNNPIDRCYHCKSLILRTIRGIADRHHLKQVIEGQNADDQNDYRPGKRAILETGTRSPLADAGLTKMEIRALAKALDLTVWQQPSSPCLATRFPYGTPLTTRGLQQVASGESFLHSRGFDNIRLRVHDNLARIEVHPEQIRQLIDMSQDVLSYYKQIGFLYVTVDLQGYRMGSLNEGLEK